MATTTATSTTDTQNYSFATDLANSVPELKTLLSKASAGHWDTQRFMDELKTTDWWKKNSDTAKQMIDLRASDPAQYSQQVVAAQRHVWEMASAMGVNLTHAQIVSMATADMFQGLSDQDIQLNIGQMYGQANQGGATAGSAAQLQMQMQQLAASYGIPVTQAWINSHVQNALAFGNGTEAARMDLVNQAKSMYPGLSQQLDAGQTVQQIAQPYVASMAQILEVDDQAIKLNDPTIQRALTGTTLQPQAAAATPKPKAGNTSTPQAPAGATPPAPAPQPGNPMTLYDFQNMLRSDPRWQHTDNAKQTAYGMLHQLGQSFGFAS